MPPPDESAQQPRTPRLHPRARLVTQVESRASGQTSVGRTDNISEGGVLVLCRETFDPQSEVIVRFTLPPGGPLEATGRVVHVDPQARMGIQFVELGPEVRQHIADYVESCQ